VAELFIPRQGRNLPPRPRPGSSPDLTARSVVVAPGGVTVIDRARPRLDDLVAEAGRARPDGVGRPEVGPRRSRRSGPRHGRRVVGAEAGPALAAVAGLVLGVVLGALAWARHDGEARPAPPTPRPALVAALAAEAAAGIG
jgi:hypothetical protein